MYRQRQKKDGAEAVALEKEVVTEAVPVKEKRGYLKQKRPREEALEAASEVSAGEALAEEDREDLVE